MSTCWARASKRNRMGIDKINFHFLVRVQWDSVTFWPYPYFFSHRSIYLHTFLRDSWYLGLHYYSLWLLRRCSCSPSWYPSPCCPWTRYTSLPYVLLAIYYSPLYWVLPLMYWRGPYRALACSARSLYSHPYSRALNLLSRACLPYPFPLWW